MTSDASPGWSAVRASSREASREVTRISSARARRMCSTCLGWLTSTTVRTCGAVVSIARMVRLERTSASLVASDGQMIAAAASGMPARSRSAALVASPRTKSTSAPAGLRSLSCSTTTRPLSSWT